jgi:hypothetical protein
VKIRTIWLIVTLAVAALFFASAGWCHYSQFDLLDGKSCAEEQGQKSGIAIIVAVVGFFLIWAIESTAGQREGTAPSSPESF